MIMHFLFFPAATEAHDHDGLPHTLEHLVFMGSEKYPYKVMIVHVHVLRVLLLLLLLLLIRVCWIY